MKRLAVVGVTLAVATAVLYGAASYPSSVKSFTTKLAGQTVASAHINDIQDEIVAIEGGLLNGFAHALKPSSGGAQDLGTSSLQWGNVFANGLRLTDATELTIASGAVTATRSYHRIDTESDAASDDLDTLTAGSGVGAGFVTVLRAENVARIVTAKDATGNLLLNGDYALSATDRTLTLIYDGTNWRELARSVPVTMVISKSTTEQDVVSTTTETSVFSFSVPAGTLSTANALRLTLTGSYLNNTGGNQNLFIAVKFGGTVIAGATSAGGAVGGGGYATSASAHPILLGVLLNANNATNSQRVNARLTVGAAQADVAWGATSLVTEHLVQHTSLAIDTTSAQTLTVTVTHGASNAALSFKRHAAVLELLQ